MKSATNALAGRPYTSTGVPTCTIRPASITATRSLIVNASAWSCVTNTVVSPVRRCNRRSHSRARSRSLASTFENGSSSSSSAGSNDSARASATRCCCPPDSSCGYRSANPPISTSSRHSDTRRARAARPTPLISNGNPTFPRTVMCGHSA